MFTRVVELISKQGKARELSSTINDKIVPILKKQAGFVDEIVLVSDAPGERTASPRFSTSVREETLWLQTTWKRFVQHTKAGTAVTSQV